MKKIIITGAGGFIGSAAAKEAAKQGYLVYAVVREAEKAYPELEKHENIKIIKCDMANYKSLPRLIQKGEFNAFYHFAWSGSSGPARADEAIQLANVECSANALRAAKELGAKKFIFASSIQEYEMLKLMQTRMAPPQSAQYSIAKLTANYMCRALAQGLGIAYISGIISNAYGPGEHSPRLINSSIRRLIKGEHVSFSPGEQLYDFIFIDDAAKLFLQIEKYGQNNAAYYIGSGNPRKLKEFLLEMAKTVGAENLIGLGDIDFKGVSLEYNEFNVKSAEQELNFKNSTDFITGIKNTARRIRLELRELFGGGGGVPSK